MWDAPPFEKTKITRFAFAAYCGGRSARGSFEDVPSASSSLRRPGMRSEPPTSERRNSRRAGMGRTFMPTTLVEVDELIHTQQRSNQRLPRRSLCRRRVASLGQTLGTLQE